MIRVPGASEAHRAIHQVARLRSLFRRLPHQPTPTEQRLVLELSAFLEGQQRDCSVLAARAGLRAAWVAGDLETLLRAGRRLPDSLVRTDRQVQTYLDLTRRQQQIRSKDKTGPSPRSRAGHGE